MLADADDPDIRCIHRLLCVDIFPSAYLFFACLDPASAYILRSSPAILLPLSHRRRTRSKARRFAADTRSSAVPTELPEGAWSRCNFVHSGVLRRQSFMIDPVALVWTGQIVHEQT